MLPSRVQKSSSHPALISRKLERPDSSRTISTAPTPLVFSATFTPIVEEIIDKYMEITFIILQIYRLCVDE